MNKIFNRTKKGFINIYKQSFQFYSKNKLEFTLLVGILLLASFMRLYRIGEFMTFLGDEGRDVIIVRRFLTEGDIFLIGPGTSIGNMYLGPMYYYMMAPALLLANFSPVGPSIMVAVLGIITTWFVWYVSREWFPAYAKASADKPAVNYSALGASFLYAIAPTVVIYSRSSWNPNIMPFFALLCVYSLWRVIKFRNNRWLWVLGFSFAAVMQSHYLGLILVPLLGLMWLLAVYLHWSADRKSFLINSIIGCVIFLVLMSPLVIFDARHGWRNFDAIKTFFTVRQTTVSARPWTALPDVYPLFEQIGTRVIAGRNEVLGSWVALGFVISLLWIATRARQLLDYKRGLAFVILISWIGIGLIGFGVYKQHIYDHYYGFLFPAFFILFAGVSNTVVRHAKLRGSWLVFTAFVFLAFYNLADTPIRYAPNRQLQRSVLVADKIRHEAGGKPFNLAIIAERNYEAAYKYFLLKEGDPVIDIDPQNADETITDQLFVVCELPEPECQPTTNAKTEVANFGWSQIDQKWEEHGVVIYKLVHVEEENE